VDVLTFTVCPQTAEETRQVIEFYLEAMTKTNELYYQRLPLGPCCPECAGVRYVPPTERDASAPGEGFVSLERLVVLGVGKCGDIAAMVAAKMRVLDRRPAVRVKVITEDAARRRFHAVVQLEDGSLLDPTHELQRVGVSASAPSCGCEV
jgi:hypothetical protein